MAKLFKIFLALTILFPSVALAQATLFISPSSGAYKVGELFSVLVNVNSGDQAINAASGQINFDNAKLEVTELGYTRSIFTIWTEEPAFSNAAGTVRFSGGVPSPGFTGASGAILRINFKTKASGQASVILGSGAVLANDGKGTNILDSLKGALFNVVAASIEEPDETPTAVPAEEKAEKPIGAPTITEYPATLQAGDILTIKGVGYPNGKILIFVQKGANDPEITERFCGVDGRFAYNFGKPVEAGYYRTWVKNVTPEGVVSDSSEAKNTEVIQPLFFRVGAVALNYVTIIVTLLGLLAFVLLISVWTWLRLRKWREEHKKDIRKTEQVVHKAFDLLKEDIEKQIKFLEKARSQRQLTEEEQRVVEYLKKDLDDTEKFLKKEIEDIEEVKE